MFTGQAEEAMQFYVSLFKDGAVLNVTRNGDAIQHATFTLNGQTFMCIDSDIKHDFTFTPSISFFVQCESVAELDRLFEALSQGGTVMMAPDNYDFSTKFTWLADRWGVSWQLNAAG